MESTASSRTLHPEEFARRRREALASMGTGSALIVRAGSPKTFSRDVDHPFRPDSDFRYLTGFNEPESIAVLRTDGEPTFTLFVRPRDEKREIWDGLRAGPEGAVSRFGADAGYALDELAKRLPELLDGIETLYFAPWRDGALDRHVRKACETLRGGARKGHSAPRQFVDPFPLLHEMRLIKSAAEVAIMELACRASAAGHAAGMRRAQPGCSERQIQAAIEAAFLEHGASCPGYETIVGAGAHGCILHYTENDGIVGKNDLILVDAGAEYSGYTGDITRTFPASGTFTSDQLRLYEVVLAAQRASIDAVKPGNTVDDVHQASLRTIVDGLIELGLLEGTRDERLEDESYQRYFMHRTSHWLGMDVHDVGAYYEPGTPAKSLISRTLAPGMILTIEPGIYVRAGEDAPEAARALDGQAVRIEDDALVTDDGCRLLTRDVPVDPDAVCDVVRSGQ